MTRTDVNPWEWSKGFGFSQAVLLEDARQVLVCSGQTAIGPDGAPPATEDMGEQIAAAVENLRTVLAGAGMSMADVARVTVFTTDMDALLATYETIRTAFAPDLPATTLIGVSRLAYPQLKVEIEATAVR